MSTQSVCKMAASRRGECWSRWAAAVVAMAALVACSWPTLAIAENITSSSSASGSSAASASASGSDTSSGTSKVFTISGCTCETECGYALQSYEWCWTSTFLSDNSNPCGQQGTGGYWDYCNSSSTSSGRTVIFLQTEFEMWYFITACTCLGVGVAYFIAGCMAARIIGKWSFLYLPFCSALLGLFLAFAVGAVSAILITRVYFSIPYWIDQSVRLRSIAHEPNACADI